MAGIQVRLVSLMAFVLSASAIAAQQPTLNPPNPPSRIVICGMDASSFGDVLNQQLRSHIERLLLSYGTRVRDFNPHDAEAGLTLDRRAVFHAAVRAMFVPISRHEASTQSRSLLADGRGGGIDVAKALKLVDYAEAVTGIWGARPNDKEGKHQFRLSIQWKSGLEDVLDKSPCFVPAQLGHVILPGAPGSDANLEVVPSVVTSGVVTYRAHVHICGIIIDFKAQPCPTPLSNSQSFLPSSLSLQVSFRKDEPSVGEFDIDFDNYVKHFHDQPSNSDPLSSGRLYGKDGWHLDQVNHHFRFVPRLFFSCKDKRNHGRDSYHAAHNCIRP